jgi:hypothetical protein
VALTDEEVAKLLASIGLPPPLSPIEKLLEESGVSLARYGPVKEWLRAEVEKRRSSSAESSAE